MTSFCKYFDTCKFCWVCCREIDRKKYILWKVWWWLGWYSWYRSIIGYFGESEVQFNGKLPGLQYNIRVIQTWVPLMVVYLICFCQYLPLPICKTSNKMHSNDYMYMYVKYLFLNFIYTANDLLPVMLWSPNFRTCSMMIYSYDTHDPLTPCGVHSSYPHIPTTDVKSLLYLHIRLHHLYFILISCISVIFLFLKLAKHISKTHFIFCSQVLPISS